MATTKATLLFCTFLLYAVHFADAMDLLSQQHSALREARKKGIHLRKQKRGKRNLKTQKNMKESSSIQTDLISLENITAVVNEELSSKSEGKKTKDRASLELDSRVRSKNAKIAATAMYGLQCFDFKKFPAGTILDANDESSALLADGDVTVRLNAEANDKVTIGVVREGKTPIAYRNSDDEVNKCLATTSNGAGLSLLPKDRSLWNVTDEQLLGKIRKNMGKKVFEIVFGFQNDETPTTYFETTLADLGDWNPYYSYPESAVAVLIAYDENNVELDRHEFRPLILGDGSYDACKPNTTLSVSAPACDYGGPCIKTVALTFSSVVGEKPTKRTGNTSLVCWDPNFSFAQICWPGAAVINDPHFTGFDGSTYDFTGHANHVFNLISDTLFQMNSKFIEGSDGKTYMGEIGIMVGANNIHIMPDKVLLNGHQIFSGQILLRNSRSVAVGVLMVRDKDNVAVHTDAYNIDIRTERWDSSNIHLNFHSSLRSQFLSNPHGVLGQTAQYLVQGTDPSPVHLTHKNKDASGFLEGEATDYLVSDGIFGTLFLFNRYGITVERASDTIMAQNAIASSTKRPAPLP